LENQARKVRKVGQ